ncbi:MAG TPA: phenylacetate--CoA ligase [bacterium]|nr:phenylacetate--CoA ligase [bacterium]
MAKKHLIWNKRYECMPDSKKKELQLERLKLLVSRVYDKVAPYKTKMDATGIAPKDIKKLEDISKLPFTTKEDLAANYPFGMFAVPMKKIIRIHSSSGTTGKPKVAGYTKNDIKMWADVMARTLTCGNTTKNDVVQNAYGYGLFTGGLGAHYGVEKIGATVVPISGGNTKRQILVMKDFGVTKMCCTPSYCLFLSEALREAELEPGRDIKLNTAFLGAEPWTRELREQVEKNISIDAIDIYGLTEVIGPGVSSECMEKVGLHIFDDNFYPEVVDPDTQQPLPLGEKGELVFTTLTKEAFPVVRYRTRDITRLIPEKCACGRTHIRMERLTGRTDDMLIIRGVNVYPSQIESVIVQIPGLEPHYQILVDRQGAMDMLEVWIEVSPGIFTDNIKGLEKLEKRIRGEMESVLGIGVKLKLVEPKAIQRSEGKAQRIIDRRTVYDK